VGGSGLIVVVIVAAWAIFLVPQLLHRRAEAAAHLADRLPAQPSDDPDDAGAKQDPAPVADVPAADTDGSSARVEDPVDLSLPRGTADLVRRHRFGRRELVRSGASASAGRGWRDRLRLRRRPAAAPRPRPVRSAAARRRRVLALLATATLVTVLAVALAGMLGLPLPPWLVALPGSLMVGYLALLALVHPGAPRPVVAARVVQPSPAAAPPPIAAAETASTREPLPVGLAAPSSAEPVPATLADEDTWTPVPVPVPTYVTAPRARRSVRTIDLSNPGSWTSVPAEPEPAAPALAGPAGTGEHDVEHLRAVGD